MTLQDIINLARIVLAEPNNQGRWSDSDMTILANRAQQQVTLELDWPESTILFTTVASTTNGAQEYQLPEILKITRVYLAGQPIVPTSIPALQGDQIQFYDMTGTNAQPQWQTQPPTAYPTTTSGSTGYGGGTGNTPWSPGSRPKWYFRGGNIGIIPAPSNAVQAQLDIIPIPIALVNTTDVCQYPDNFRDALAWKIAEFALYADNNQEVVGASQAYDKCIVKLRKWIDDMNMMMPKSPFPRTTRMNFRGGVQKRMTSYAGTTWNNW
jgi:hypothetical protein